MVPVKQLGDLVQRVSFLPAIGGELEHLHREETSDLIEAEQEQFLDSGNIERPDRIKGQPLDRMYPIRDIADPVFLYHHLSNHVNQPGVMLGPADEQGVIQCLFTEIPCRIDRKRAQHDRNFSAENDLKKELKKKLFYIIIT